MSETTCCGAYCSDVCQCLRERVPEQVNGQAVAVTP
jgi:hypothetical protein